MQRGEMDQGTGEEAHSRKQGLGEKLERVCAGTCGKLGVAENKTAETRQRWAKARLWGALCAPQTDVDFTLRPWKVSGSLARCGF